MCVSYSEVCAISTEGSHATEAEETGKIGRRWSIESRHCEGIVDAEALKATGGGDHDQDQLQQLCACAAPQPMSTAKKGQCMRGRGMDGDADDWAS